jgi:hypothetical protein
MHHVPPGNLNVTAIHRYIDCNYQVQITGRGPCLKT